MTIVTDTRENSKNKSATNRKKFLDRYKDSLKRSVKDIAKKRSIKDMKDKADITIDGKSIDEPTFQKDSKQGKNTRVLPGNKKFKKGDQVKRPPEGDGSESGASNAGEGLDEFTFTLTKEEFLEIYFGDLELPDFVKKGLLAEKVDTYKRAGYTKYGIPPRLNIKKTFENALARKIATRGQSDFVPVNVPGYEEYLISPTGIILGKDKKQPLKPYPNRAGYLSVDLYKANAGRGRTAGNKIGREVFSIHRLVALTFISNPEQKSDVNHIDGNKINNHVSNLEWCTRSENVRHAIQTMYPEKNRGEKNPRANVTNLQVSEIRALHESGMLTQKELAIKYNVSEQSIYRILTYKTWPNIKPGRFLDDEDLRYDNTIVVRQPIRKAVMFCVMDVSGSMGETHKDLAKKFFLLLYLFLEKNYEEVEVVFVKYHTDAFECSEEEFFYGRETGGTVASRSLEVVNEIIDDRYDISKTNLYIAHASDGDDWPPDLLIFNDKLDELLPKIQYYAYVEIGGNFLDSDLMEVFGPKQETIEKINTAKVMEDTDVYEALRNLFEKKG